MEKKIVSWESNTAPATGAMEAKIRAHQQVLDAELAGKELLNKAMPLLKTLLNTRLKNGVALRITRPLVYATSALPQEEEDDGFYFVRKSEGGSKFVDVQVQIPVGEELLLKTVDSAMHEFIFKDTKGREHAISFSQQELLMTRTNIYDDVLSFMDKNT